MNNTEETSISEIVEMSSEKEKIVEYVIPFQENFIRGVNKFIEEFHTSQDIIFDRLIRYHLELLLHEIENRDIELLSSYYFCLDKIFSNNGISVCDQIKELNIQTKNVSVKLNSEINIVIKIICEEIHYKPEVFIKKALQYQWESIRNDIEAGYYYIIEDFCNLPRIKNKLE